MKRYDKHASVAFVYCSTTGAASQMIYEDRPLGEVLKCHRRAIGLIEVADLEKARLIVAVNAPGIKQGEAFAQPNYTDVETPHRHLPEFIDTISYCTGHLGKPVAILDVAYANGCDNRFMKLLLNNKEIDMSHLSAISGWNTAGNTIGSGLAMGIISALFEHNETARIKAVFMRLIDDWLYQANIRQQVYESLGKPSVFHLGDLHKKAEAMVCEKMKTEMKAIWEKYCASLRIKKEMTIQSIVLPWPRLFCFTAETNIEDKKE